MKARGNPIVVLWPWPRHSFLIDFPELKERRIIFVTDRNNIHSIYGLSNLQYIWPEAAYRLPAELRDEFVNYVKCHNFIEYRRDSDPKQSK